ncbi:unnamed protein product [Dibothriocephalus latus]|uniref:Uncharacterized protein n=1 Tax=Dibothriocephalus latus TaxID=60516 RepID=A0A3P6RJH8_DIBLA|nr:unnamed protein product [Dibothriocephalus latus]
MPPRYPPPNSVHFWATMAREFSPSLLPNLAEAGLGICQHSCLNAYVWASFAISYKSLIEE